MPNRNRTQRHSRTHAGFTYAPSVVELIENLHSSPGYAAFCRIRRQAHQLLAMIESLKAECGPGSGSMIDKYLNVESEHWWRDLDALHYNLSFSLSVAEGGIAFGPDEQL